MEGIRRPLVEVLLKKLKSSSDRRLNVHCTPMIRQKSLDRDTSKVSQLFCGEPLRGLTK